MQYTDKLPVLIVRYSGIYDYEGLIVLIVTWLKQRKFWFKESTVKHKVPSPLGAEEERKFEAERKVDGYRKEVINIYFHLWEMINLEVMDKGKKKLLTQARMEIRLSGSVILDYQNKWEKSELHLKIRDFIHAHIYTRKVLDAYCDDLYYRIVKLHNLIKEYLGMQTKSREFEGYLKDNV